ncbi:MAG TPA: hypothetical protein VLA00_14670 [Xanthobacteraceae bacterium]|nr:hypothetical protein [Xanthobacteraceae bacterium]
MKYSRRPRPARRVTIDIADVLAADSRLAQMDAQWLASGYARTSCRLWRCKDGTYTARLVWRNRSLAVSTVSLSVEGIMLG